MARPTKLTAALAEQLAAGVAAGATYRAAAAAAGVGERTLHDWLTRGRRERDRRARAREELQQISKRRGNAAARQRAAARRDEKPVASETPFEELLERVEKASGVAEVRAAAQIAAAGAESWRAAAWFLERRDPASWAAPRVLAAENEPAAPAPVPAVHDLSRLNVAELRAFAELLRKVEVTVEGSAGADVELRQLPAVT